MKNTFRQISLSALLVLLSLSSAVAGSDLIRPGDLFPEIRLAAPAAVTDRNYLQIDSSVFTPSQIKSELLLVELLNVHCPHCKMQAPAYNELFKLIDADPMTRDRIKLLGIAVGNLETEVATFKKGFQVPFPLIADPDFSAWRAIGAGSTPFSIYVRQNQPGEPGIVTGTHLGLNTDYLKLLKTLLQMTDSNLEQLKQRANTARVKRSQQLKPPQSAAKLEYRIRSAFTRFGRIESFSEVALMSGRKVYSATVRREEKTQRLFAELTSRGSICDICHDVHFFYLFDRSTQIIAFEPLQLTKYGNINWGKTEIDKMRKRIVGRYLSMPQPFDPKVDAISSATMTSAIIFDSLSQGDELIQELRGQGLLE